MPAVPRPRSGASVSPRLSRPSRLRRPLALGAALAAAVLLLAGPAASAQGTAGSGGSGDGGDGGWQPYQSGPEDDPAGTLCPFHLYIGVLTEGEEIRTAARYPDGSPEKVLFRGPLVLRYSNLDTGKSVDRDQSGRATLYYRPDGSKLWVVPRTSHISARIRPGNPYHAVGDYLFSGGVTLLIHPDGNPQVLAQHQVENLCQTLG